MINQNQNNISLEKVINGLECCLSASMGEITCLMCMYRYDENGVEDGDCEINLLKDAIALLKAQKPRVMTWEEAKASVNNGPFIIFEVRDSTGSELDFGVLVNDRYEMSEGSLLTAEFFPKMEDVYGKRFRMWTFIPDKATREATPWE